MSRFKQVMCMLWSNWAIVLLTQTEKEALARWDGSFCVVLSRDPLLGEFLQLLVRGMLEGRRLGLLLPLTAPLSRIFKF